MNELEDEVNELTKRVEKLEAYVEKKQLEEMLLIDAMKIKTGECKGDGRFSGPGGGNQGQGTEPQLDGTDLSAKRSKIHWLSTGLTEPGAS